jgi:hypothetical protein
VNQLDYDLPVTAAVPDEVYSLKTHPNQRVTISSAAGGAKAAVRMFASLTAINATDGSVAVPRGDNRFPQFGMIPKIGLQAPAISSKSTDPKAELRVRIPGYPQTKQYPTQSSDPVMNSRKIGVLQFARPTTLSRSLK